MRLNVCSTTFSRVFDNYFPTRKAASKPVIAVDRLSAASTRFEAANTPIDLDSGGGGRRWNIVGGRYLAGNWWCDDGSHPVANVSWPGVGADRPYVINETASAVDRLPLFIPNNFNMC